METLGKALSLILITLFGVGTAVVHILDYSEPKVIDSLDQASDYSAKPDLEVQSYREEFRKNLSIEILESTTASSNQKSLWTETYRTDRLSLDSATRSEIIELAKSKTFNQLNNEMKYWYKQYNLLIQKPNRKQSAKDAYNKYRIYKEALSIKRAYK